jgi:hypothetical protein
VLGRARTDDFTLMAKRRHRPQVGPSRPAEGTAALALDRRAQPRLTPVRELHGKLSASGMSLAFWAKVVNISSIGICLLVHHHLPQGLRFRLDLRALADGRVFRLCAQVVHLEALKTGDTLTGCVLEQELSDAELQAILGL